MRPHGGLGADLQRTEDHAAADAKDDEGGGPDGVLVEEEKEAAAERGDGPAEPDGPAEAACARDEAGDDDGARDAGTGCGEEVQSGADRGGGADGGDVEWDVIEGDEELSVGGLSAEGLGMRDEVESSEGLKMVRDRVLR